MSIAPDAPRDILDEWSSWNASRRIAALRRWLLDMEWSWGAVANWPALCAEEWVSVKEQDSSCVTAWLDGEAKKVATGRRMLGYFVRVMEGTLPTDMEVLRDIYLQGHQLSCTLHTAVIGLEQTLGVVRKEVQTDSSRKCNCGNTTCAA